MLPDSAVCVRTAKQAKKPREAAFFPGSAGASRGFFSETYSYVTTGRATLRRHALAQTLFTHPCEEDFPH